MRVSIGVAPPFRKSNGESSAAEKRHLLAAPDAGAFDRRAAGARSSSRPRGSPNRAARSRRRRGPRRSTAPFSKRKFAERHVAGEGQLQGGGAGIERPVAPVVGVAHQPDHRPHHAERADLHAADDEAAGGGSCRSADPWRRPRASSIPSGPPTCTSFKVTLSRGKISISGSPESDTSRPVQAAICSPMRVRSVSRGRSTTRSAKSAAAKSAAAAENPEDALHSNLRDTSRQPAIERGRADGKAGRLGLSRPLWQWFLRPFPRSEACMRNPSGAPIPLRSPTLPLSALHAGGGPAGRQGFRRLRGAACLVDRGAGAFWDLVWDFCGVVGEKGARKIARRRLDAGDALLPGGAAEFRREPHRGEAKARRSSSAARTRSSAACRGRSYARLVSRLQQAMLALGIGAGDRVAAMLPNMPEAIAFMLAAASHRRDLLLLLARFRRARRARPLRPDRAEALRRPGRLLVRRQGDRGRGKAEGDRDAAAERREGRRRSLSRPRRRSGVDRFRAAKRSTPSSKASRRRRSASSGCPSTIRSISFSPPARRALPKCIVHGAGGTLLQHLKEHRLHCSLTPER